ncbi:MAG: uroporphyrinogen-III C-methyltransferase [Hydrogenothermus sp.]|nr:MAG: uroporphyrinogen-III C-methyltransferase [Hydrogenothermus sp.]
MGKVYIVGCGPGDPELLTLKAFRIIQNLDVALIDHLISEEIIQLIPKKTKIIYVGKQKGKITLKQEEINKLMYELAKQELLVGRLKSGDPYIFGRGAEEAIYLLERGIDVEVISGVSSALAAPLYAGIAPTCRGYATNLSIVSAHLRGNKFNKDWIPLLKIPNHTTIVLMGLSRAKEIKEEALKHDIPTNMPVAIISNATRENQKTFITTLEELPEIAKKAEKPAILVFGNVVKLNKYLLKKKNYELKSNSKIGLNKNYIKNV